MPRISLFARAIFFTAVTSTAACSDDSAGGSDSGAPRTDANHDTSAADLPANDVSSDGDAIDTSLDSSILDAVGDPLSDEAATDGDSACTCTLIDSGLPSPFSANGVMSLPCYCAKPWAGLPGAADCASYDVATRCDTAVGNNFSVETYTNCNLVTVRYGSFGADARVYDHTTHELVGAYRGTDYSVPCGGSLALLIFAGIIPGPECQTAKIEAPCLDAGPVVPDARDGPPPEDADARDSAPPDDGDARDAAPPADADGGCECEPDEQHVTGHMSLACYCAGGRCRTYDEALTTCGSDAPPDANRVNDYEACNLVVMTSGTSIPGGGSYVFDRTTHELVGASGGADYPAFQCGDASVFGFQAGTFPPPGCTVSRSVPRCPRDGGGD